MSPGRDETTIHDFGEQWTHFTGNEGYHASLALFVDHLGPLVDVNDFRGARVADIGSGTGRIVRMLHAAGARSIVAVEPSAGMNALRRNTADIRDQISYLEATGDKLPAGLDLDFIVSFGVVHHIPAPLPVLRAAHAALRPGGRLVVWLYGREGNELYLSLFGPIRRVTTKISHAALVRLSRLLTVPLDAYIALARRFPLPMREYMVEHLGKLTRAKRTETIYDQLNPHEARYYRRAEAEALVADAGFADVKSFHRHGYSWTVVGVKRDGAVSTTVSLPPKLT